MGRACRPRARSEPVSAEQEGVRWLAPAKLALSQSKKKKEGGSPTGSTGSSPTAKAAALLAEALDRSSINATASYDGKTSAYDGKTAASIFDEAFDAAKLGDFEATLRVLADVSKQDALLQALLQAQADTPEGHTLLHQAASHGHVQGVRDLLRRGADAARLNLEGQSSLDVAQEKGHDEVTRMLHVWTDAWSGWDAEEPWVTLPPRYLLRGGSVTQESLTLTALPTP